MTTEFHDAGAEIENPDDMISATRYEIRVGVKALVEGGEYPYVSARMIGHPHTPGGGIDTTRVVSCHFILQREHAIVFAEQFAQACLEEY